MTTAAPARGHLTRGARGGQRPQHRRSKGGGSYAFGNGDRYGGNRSLVSDDLDRSLQNPKPNPRATSRAVLVAPKSARAARACMTGKPVTSWACRDFQLAVERAGFKQ
jgi:hypothetical protein